MLPALLQRSLGFAWQVIDQIQTSGLAAKVLTWVVMASILPKKPAAKEYYLIGFGALALFG